MLNSVDPDETAEPYHLALRCLQKHISIAYGSEIVKLVLLDRNFKIPFVYILYIF